MTTSNVKPQNQCPTCQGIGQDVTFRKIEPGKTILWRSCPACEGTGLAQNNISDSNICAL